MFRPKYKHSNPQVRLEAVKELDDENILIDIAKNYEDYNVSLNTVYKIKDEKTLNYIAKNDSYSIVREEAVKKIKDEKTLNYIARYDSYRERKRSFTRRNMDRVIGFSDHDGYEYELEEVTEYLYPVRKVASKKLGLSQNYYLKEEISKIDSLYLQ